MTLQLWIILFIISMAVSAEVLAWAVQHGQFTQVDRARVYPLRAAGSGETAKRPRRRASIGLWLGIAALTFVWAHAMWRLVQIAT